MRRMIVVMIAGAALVVASPRAGAFNPVAHLEITDEVFSRCDYRTDLHYGAVAPDLVSAVADPADWPTAFDDTHYGYIDLRSDATSARQLCFASGWLSHSEAIGADHYAHVEYPAGVFPGYVEQKAAQLTAETGLDPGFAHYAIEVAIDVLIDAEHPARAWQLLFANLLRSWQDRNLLARVLVWEQGRTSWWTLVESEVALRALVHQYASALVLPTPLDQQALAELGAQLAAEQFGIDVTPEEVLWLLQGAIELCSGDYRDALDYAVAQIALDL